ncbi:DeoR/GlpR family DNA-binding transcription regulator [Vibrio mediterranei]|uniref:DeoR/GlpR family DNA-binding transcription regulator n=1 Tax=Vibrio mediterranei TaxID=689 RepID=UPI0038CDEB8C
MQQSKRTEIILEHVKTNKHASIQELVVLTNSSAATVRRDVNRLAETGQVFRERGGISLHRSINRQPTTAEKRTENLKVKKAIALEACNHIVDGMSVFLDAGTTSFELAVLLNKKHDLRVFTTDLKIAYYLSEENNHEVIMIGGNIDNCSQSVIGSFSNYILNNIIPDICFSTCSAFDFFHGVTSPTQEKALLKQKLASLGKTNILLTDSSKYNYVGTHKIASLETYDLLISDKELANKLPGAAEALIQLELVS